MKQLFNLLSIGVTSVFIFVGAQAQQNQPTPVVEIFPCTYRGNNGIENLRTVSARFNTWADRNNQTNYTAFIATPYAYSADLEADVLWLGDSMEAFGKGTDMYTGGGFMRAEELFGRLLDCNSARVYTIERVRLAAQTPSG